MRIIDTDALEKALDELFRKTIDKYGFSTFEDSDRDTQLILCGIMDAIEVVLDLQGFEK